jgi:putative spermidine/putrescine transport system permease protein
MQNVGANRAFEPAALAVISFAITWAAMGMIQLLARFAPRTAPLTD